MRSSKILMGAVVLGAALASSPSPARVKLSALPVRERVEIRLDNGGYTLVEEERIIPLLKSSISTGNNMIDFSWSNTSIDKDSIRFRPLSVREGDKFRPVRKVTVDGHETLEVAVINVSYPPGENALVWEVFAKDACAVKVRVSYLVSGLTRSFSYRALAGKDEKTLTLRHYLKVLNHSGEGFGRSWVWAGMGDPFEKLIAGNTDIKVLLARFESVPVKKTYTLDWYAHGPLNQDKPFASKVLMHYVLDNVQGGALGRYPLPGGKVRIFMEDGRGGQAFLGEDVTGAVPLDSEMKLYLGEARDIVCVRKVEMNERHNVRGNLYDQEMIIAYEIENFKDQEVTLRIVEQMNRIGSEYFGNTHGEVEWEKGKKTSGRIKLVTDEGFTTPVLEVGLPAADKNGAADKVEVKFHFTLKNMWG